LFGSLCLRPGTRIGPALVVAVVLSLAGCQGPKKKPVGEVFGKVTFEGRPVSHGIVTFMNSDAGDGDEATLNPDGTYAVKTPLPVGEYRVFIIPPVVYQKVDVRGPEVGVEMATKEIPPKYRTIGTTDLKATVKEGRNECNFDMKR
jgi:hypothetical protein